MDVPHEGPGRLRQAQLARGPVGQLPQPGADHVEPPLHAVEPPLAGHVPGEPVGRGGGQAREDRDPAPGQPRLLRRECGEDAVRPLEHGLAGG